jgi:hypothetical protein
MQHWVGPAISRLLLRGPCALALFLLVVAVHADPKVGVPNDKIDLGVMRVGQDREAVFEIENRGDAPLLIFEVEPGCSCTATEYDREIQPGDSGQIRARLTTSDLSGPVTKGIVVTTNDPATPTVVLTLEGTVLTNFELLPQPVIFMRTEPDGSVVGRMLVRKQNDVEGAADISKLQVSRDIFDAKVSQITEARPRGGGVPAAKPGDWLVEVSFRSGVTRFGRIREKLRFETGLTVQPSLEVPIESSFDVPVAFSTETLELNLSSDGRWRGSCFASVRKGTDPSELRVSSKPEGVTLTTSIVGERIVRLDLEAATAIDDSKIEFMVGKHRLSLPLRAAP